MVTSSVEEYLEAIYFLEEERISTSTMEIAKRVGVSPPSVTEMLRRLADRGYIRYEPYRGVVLTDQGRRVGRRVTRKHRILECFLHDILSIRKDRAHRQACEMEHALSDEAEDRLHKIMKYPDRCPDGKVIPTT